MASKRASEIHDVKRFNDELAREHDIDAYYERSSPLIRFIEGRRLAHIRRLVRMRPGERLLEVGCGGGHVLRLFPQADLTGVDVSPVMLTKARRNLAGFRATLLEGELGQLDLAAESFDAIVCTEVLEHAVDPEAMVAQMAGLVRPSGRVVITFPNDYLIGALKDAVQYARLDRLPPFRRVSWGGDDYHLHAWTLEEMRALLMRTFSIDEERFAPHRWLPIRCCFRCSR